MTGIEQVLRQELRKAENELQRLRGDKALIAALVNDPAYDLSTRIALAERLRIPAPPDARKEHATT